MENVKFNSGIDHSASFKKETFSVEGMSCGSCANSVQRKLSQLEGVKSAVVSLPTSSATLEYNPTLVDSSKMKEAVESLGYTFGMKDSRNENKSKRSGGCC